RRARDTVKVGSHDQERLIRLMWQRSCQQIGPAKTRFVKAHLLDNQARLFEMMANVLRRLTMFLRAWGAWSLCQRRHMVLYALGQVGQVKVLGHESCLLLCIITRKQSPR